MKPLRIIERTNAKSFERYCRTAIADGYKLVTANLAPGLYQALFVAGDVPVNEEQITAANLAAVGEHLNGEVTK